MSNEKNPSCLEYVGDYTVQLNGMIITHHCKDPNSTTIIMESKRVFSWLKWLRDAKGCISQIRFFSCQKEFTENSVLRESLACLSF